jgi:hypothetical protein
LTELLSENIIDWDEHPFTMLFSYKTTYKITRYSPYQLVYGLHPLMPTQYIVHVATLALGSQPKQGLMKV